MAREVGRKGIVDKLSNREKVLIVFDSYGEQLDRESVNSMIYMLRKKGIDFQGYRYIPYSGNHSFELQSDIDFLVSLDTLLIRRDNGISYKISDAGSQILRKRRAEEAEFRQAYDQIDVALKALLEEFPFKELVKMAYLTLSREIAEPTALMR